MNNKDLKDMERLFGKTICDKPTKGFYTRRQIEKMWNLSETVVAKRLNSALKNNLLEVRMFRIKSGLVTRPIPHYKIISK